MLVESKRVKDWLNKTVFPSSVHLGTFGDTDPAWHPPSTQGVSLNPMPALIIFLLGLTMGSHQQEKMISTMMHRQWGTLLAGGALARAVTYILLYIKPPTSYLPSRPPSEIIGSFCLVSGGLLFMLSVSCPSTHPPKEEETLDRLSDDSCAGIGHHQRARLVQTGRDVHV
jgi:Protein of unknown function (Ytp1)